jgi:hypothetical protein
MKASGTRVGLGEVVACRFHIGGLYILDMLEQFHPEEVAHPARGAKAVRLVEAEGPANKRATTGRR